MFVSEEEGAYEEGLGGRKAWVRCAADEDWSDTRMKFPHLATRRNFGRLVALLVSRWASHGKSVSLLSVDVQDPRVDDIGTEIAPLFLGEGISGGIEESGLNGSAFFVIEKTCPWWTMLWWATCSRYHLLRTSNAGRALALRQAHVGEKHPQAIRSTRNIA